jgi:hypothetical protein
MAKPGMPHARWAVLGVSLWSFYQGHAGFQSVQSEKKTQWDRYLASEYGHYGPDFKTADFFRPPAWDEVFAPNLYTLSKHRGRTRTAEDAAAFFTQQAQASAQGNFGAGEASDPRALEKLLTGYRPTFPLLEGLTDSQCASYHGEELLAPVLQATARIADRVVLYVPPISPRLRDTLPPCYLADFDKTIASFRSPSTLIADAKAADYGLTDSDYLYVGEADGVAHYDANHTNFAGAVKVSRRFAQKLRAELTESPGAPR